MKNPMTKKHIVLIALLLTMAVAVVFSGCGKTEMTEPAETESGESVPMETEAEEEPEEEAGAVEVAAEDFQIFDLGDGTCEIGACYMETSVIEVPETIDELTVVGIGGFAFADEGIEEIILPDTVEYINENGFNSCRSLRNVDLGNGLKTIGTMAFYNCPELESVVFPEGMESIAYSIFDASEKLEEVYIPASVTTFDGEIALDVLCPNLVVVTPAGSAAEEMAIAAGLPVRNSNIAA